jgi:hypothetical protein
VNHGRPSNLSHGRRRGPAREKPSLVAGLPSRSSLWKEGRPQAPFHGIRHRLFDRGIALPLKLCPPRAGKSPNWTIRGSYLGVRVDQTTGTADGKLARKILAKVKGDIERGAFSRPGAPTFAAAALRYVESGADERFILKLADHFGELPLARIDQAAIDAAALALYPRATPATRNRQVYSPMSAILKAAGVADRLKRPKGGRGARRLFFLTPDQAERLLDAAAATDAEFGLFLGFLLYTGCRLSEGLAADLADMNLAESWIYLRHTKNGEPRLAHLPPALVAALACHPRGRVALIEPASSFDLGKTAGSTFGSRRQRRRPTSRYRTVWPSMSSGTHGARGCAAMEASTQAGL